MLNMKASKQRMQSVLRWIDGIFYILDARAPTSCLHEEFSSMAKDKQLIYIFTKIDLADPKRTEEHLLGFSNSIPVCTKSQVSKKILLQKIQPLLLPMKKNRFLVVGMPNVGKSSFINALIGRRAAKTGNLPGITQNLHFLLVSKQLELVDSPGLLWTNQKTEAQKYHIGLINCVREEKIHHEELALYLLTFLQKQYPHSLYKQVPWPQEKIDPLYIWIQRCCKQFGLFANDIGFYQKVIHDFRKGLLGRISLDMVH